ncbi:hypothetical protein K7I13_08490 [Brucepastera parasyntrophica]|uniref:hypothetical protein n=1 Tax=Brucepastera parasyntrophica TaxID=2880008 RepID=UPI00210C12BD|nr:hypothetical protein [Brucepastera parasyntrophica]ULQ58604.1 hypothetical protein K7I13_08490 [Brucepastera parasyntrophica]
MNNMKNKDADQISIVSAFPQGKFEITKIIDDENLMVYLENKNAELIISFGMGVLSYHKIEEECDYDRVENLMTYLKEKNIELNTLYQISNSSMIKKITSQPLNLLDEDLIKHYLIISCNYLMDIITMDEYSLIESQGVKHSEDG